ncbi:EAL domain-containing protein [Paenibacillus sabuli]|uniref:EAL domain-containing protein n=1 Tax=Paenibacillus sabuli TaxID=2772509 RepID=UPI00295C2AF2|nr:EAL domain-containing protein [Paenibacillus sabuli]
MSITYGTGAGKREVYRSEQELLELLTALHRADGEQRVRITGRSGAVAIDSGELPLATYIARLHHADLTAIIKDKQFRCFMQPIVRTADESVYAYEFLLRPLPGGADFQAARLFEVARQTGLHSFLDRQARICAIETGARHLPHGIKRFINFLPSSIYNPSYCLTHTFDAIRSHAQQPSDYVFEVVETEKIDDVRHLQRVFDAYRTSGMRVALDDVGQGSATPQLVCELRPDVVKIDRSLVTGCDHRPEQQRAIDEIIALAASFGGEVLAEGIETPAEWAYLRRTGVHFGQGYLLGRPAAEPLVS